jgi:hypothetical protein
VVMYVVVVLMRMVVMRVFVARALAVRRIRHGHSLHPGFASRTLRTRRNCDTDAGRKRGEGPGTLSGNAEMDSLKGGPVMSSEPHSCQPPQPCPGVVSR